MTGFGRAESERDGRVLIAEVRSVNHRYLELSIRLPRGLNSLENKLRTHIQKSITRGKVNLSLYWKGAGEEGSNLSLDMDLTKRYYEILQEVRNTFELREPVTLGQLLSHPEVLKFADPDVDLDVVWEHVEDVVNAAVGELVSMRKTEGAAMAKDLVVRMETMRGLLKEVEVRSPHRVAEAKEKLHNRVKDLLDGEAKVDEERLILEAAFQAERMDYTEECVRLHSHFDQLKEMLEQGGAVGRKLNFLTQEMNRETNTIGSKANDMAVSRQVIQLKEETEIIREQIQNIE